MMLSRIRQMGTNNLWKYPSFWRDASL